MGRIARNRLPSFMIFTLVFVDLLSKREGEEQVEEDVAGEGEQNYVSPVDLEDECCNRNSCHNACEYESYTVVCRSFLELEREHRYFADK